MGWGGGWFFIYFYVVVLCCLDWYIDGFMGFYLIRIMQDHVFCFYWWPQFLLYLILTSTHISQLDWHTLSTYTLIPIKSMQNCQLFLTIILLLIYSWFNLHPINYCFVYWFKFILKIFSLFMLVVWVLCVRRWGRWGIGVVFLLRMLWGGFWLLVVVLLMLLLLVVWWFLFMLFVGCLDFIHIPLLFVLIVFVYLLCIILRITF